VARGWRCGPIEFTPQDINLLKNVSNIVKKSLNFSYRRQERQREGVFLSSV
jgi:hypothetical protein